MVSVVHLYCREILIRLDGAEQNGLFLKDSYMAKAEHVQSWATDSIEVERL
jgi:hypothetical protein